MPYSTLVDLLRYRAQEQAEQIAYRFLQDGKMEKAAVTYQDLDRQARAIAGTSTQSTKQTKILASRFHEIY